MTESNPLRDFWLAQVESRILAGRSIYQYYYGINDVYAWMVSAGSKLEGGANWVHRHTDVVWHHEYGSEGDIGRSLRWPELVVNEAFGQEAKDAHLDELKRGLKAYSTSSSL